MISLGLVLIAKLTARRVKVWSQKKVRYSRPEALVAFGKDPLRK